MPVESFLIAPASVSHGNVKGIVDCTNDAFMADAFFKKPEYHLRFTQEDVGRLMHTENSIFLVALPNSNDNNYNAEVSSREIMGSLYLHWEWKRLTTTTSSASASTPVIEYTASSSTTLDSTSVVDSSRQYEITGKFSAVSVPRRFEKRGIGNALVRAAEEYIISLAQKGPPPQIGITAVNSVDSSGLSGSELAVQHSVPESPSASQTSLSSTVTPPPVADLAGPAGPAAVETVAACSAVMEMGVINVRTDLFPWYEKQGYQIICDLPWDEELTRIIAEEYAHVRCVLMRKRLLL
jgi:hypothetical protein